MTVPVTGSLPETGTKVKVKDGFLSRFGILFSYKIVKWNLVVVVQLLPCIGRWRAVQHMLKGVIIQHALGKRLLVAIECQIQLAHRALFVLGKP